MGDAGAKLSRRMNVQQGRMPPILGMMGERTGGRIATVMPLIEKFKGGANESREEDAMPGLQSGITRDEKLFADLAVNTYISVKNTQIMLSFIADAAHLDGVVSRFENPEMAGIPRRMRIHANIQRQLREQLGKQSLIDAVLAGPGILEVEITREIPLKGLFFGMLGKPGAEKLFMGLHGKDDDASILRKMGLIDYVLDGACAYLQSASDAQDAQAAVANQMLELGRVITPEMLQLVETTLCQPTAELQVRFQGRYDEVMNALKVTLQSDEYREGLGCLIIE